MDPKPRIIWTVDPEQATHEDAREILDQIKNQVETQTEEEIEQAGVEQLAEVEAAEILIQFVISTSSAVVAQSILNTLQNRPETEHISADNIDVSVDAKADGDVEVEIDIDK